MIQELYERYHTRCNEVLNDLAHEPNRQFTSQDIINLFVNTFQENWQATTNVVLGEPRETTTEEVEDLEVYSEHFIEEVKHPSGVRASYYGSKIYNRKGEVVFEHPFYMNPNQDTSENSMTTIMTAIPNGEELQEKSFDFDKKLMVDAMRDFTNDKRKLGNKRNHFILKNYSKCQELMWQNQIKGIKIEGNRVLLKTDIHNLVNFNNLGLKPQMELCSHRSLKLSRKQLKRLCSFPNILLHEPFEGFNQQNVFLLSNVEKDLINKKQLDVVSSFNSVFKEFILRKLVDYSNIKFEGVQPTELEYQMHLTKYYFERSRKGFKYVEGDRFLHNLSDRLVLSYKSSTNLEETRLDKIDFYVNDQIIEKEEIKRSILKKKSIRNLHSSLVMQEDAETARRTFTTTS